MFNAAKVNAGSRARLRGEKTCRQHIMAPHDLIHTIFAYDEWLFQSLFLGAPGDIEDYWDHNWQHALNFPEFDDRAIWEQIIPLRIYGDGADVNKSGTLHFELLSLLPTLTASSSTLDSRLLLAVRSTYHTDPSALHDLSAVIAWSFEALSCLANTANGFFFRFV